MVTRMTRDSRAREIVLLDLSTGSKVELVREQSQKGFAPLPAAVAAPGVTAYLRYVNGWPNLCLMDLTSGDEVVVNPGMHEDLTDVHDPPDFSPDGRYLAFNSSAADLHQRHLYVHDLQTGRLQRRSFAVGATAAKAWLGSDRPLFVESDELNGAALRWQDLDPLPPAAAASPEPTIRTVLPAEVQDEILDQELRPKTAGMERDPANIRALAK